MLPACGLGAVARARSPPRANSDMPTAKAAMKPMSERRMGSFSSQGPSSRMYKGAVDCRKMALAAVVKRVASTNRIRVARRPRHRRDPPGPAPPRLRHNQQERGRGHRGPETGHLPSRETGRLNGGAAGGKQGCGRHQEQPVAQWGRWHWGRWGGRLAFPPQTTRVPAPSWRYRFTAWSAW